MGKDGERGLMMPKVGLEYSSHIAATVPKGEEWHGLLAKLTKVMVLSKTKRRRRKRTRSNFD